MRITNREVVERMISLYHADDDVHWENDDEHLIDRPDEDKIKSLLAQLDNWENWVLVRHIPYIKCFLLYGYITRVAIEFDFIPRHMEQIFLKIQTTLEIAVERYEADEESRIKKLVEDMEKAYKDYLMKKGA